MSDLITAKDAILISLTNVLGFLQSFLPALFGASVVVLLGWLVSHWAAKLIDKTLTTVGFEKFAGNAGLNKFLERSGSTWTTSKALGELTKWVVRLMTIQAAASILNMPQITEVIHNVLMFTPKLVVALVLLAVGTMFANFLSRAVRGSVSEMGLGNANMFSNLIYYSVVGFSVIAALSHLEIAPTIINTLFIAIVGTVALACGLAFGLGGKEVASEVTRNWYNKTKTGPQKETHTTKRAA